MSRCVALEKGAMTLRLGLLYLSRQVDEITQKPLAQEDWCMARIALSQWHDLTKKAGLNHLSLSVLAPTNSSSVQNSNSETPAPRARGPRALRELPCVEHGREASPFKGDVIGLPHEIRASNATRYTSCIRHRVYHETGNKRWRVLCSG